MTHFKRHPVDYVLILIVIVGTLLLIFSSCNRGIFQPSMHISTCQNYYQEIGRYDTSTTIKAPWYRGTTTIIYLYKALDDNCVAIWGKRCEFEKEELLFVEAEYWGSIGRCKYFLINEAGSLRYSLSDR